MRPPRAPDLLAVWRQHLMRHLPADVAVGVKRPANTENLTGRFVRIMCLGGPWRDIALWYPRLALESWAPTVGEARELDSIAGWATRTFEGHHHPATDTAPGFHITDCRLDLSGSDQSIDGSPFVLTTTEPVCVQVTTKETP